MKSLNSKIINSRLCSTLISVLFMAIGLFAVTETAWAAWSGSGQGVNKSGTWYVLYEGSTEVTISAFGTKTYNLSGPGASLTFDAKRQMAGTGRLQVTDNNDNSVFNNSLSTSYAAKSGTVNSSATSLDFYNAGTLRKYIKNVHVTMAQYLENPSKSSLDFGSADINTADASKTFTIAWCNVPAMSYEITGTDKDLFTVSVDVNSEAGKYNTSTFTVKYKHTTAGTHSATLKITDTYGSYSKTVTLSGTTKKLQPSITWSSNDAIFNVDDVLAATNSNDLTVTLSGNSTYVTCSGNVATMIAATSGAITITAHVTGNAIYADKDFTKDITITNLEKQYITWTQDFSRLKTTDGTKSITLSATSDSGLPVTYELVGDKTGLSLTQSGNTWTLNYSASECKNTTIVARQDGNATYAPAPSVSKTIKVIDPTKVCDTNETLVNSTVTLKSQSTTYNIDIPSTMTIQVSRTKTGLFDIYLYGFKVEIYSGRNGTGDKLHEYSYEAGDINNSKTISLSNLNIAAKSVKLISEASNGYNVTSVTYTKQKDCKLSTSSLSFETYPNTITSAQSFNVNYANYPITLECSNPKFSFTPTESFGDCLEYGTQQVSVTYTAGAEGGNDVGYIYVKDNTGTTLQTCTLTVVINKLAQSIVSTNIKSSYLTTELQTLSAVANSGLTEFTYSATPAGIASISGSQLTFTQWGTIAITVTQLGNATYAPTSATISNIEVSRDNPTIATNPSVAEIKYLDNLNNNQLSGGRASITLRNVANTTVPGTFVWTNAGAQVTDDFGSHNYSVTFVPDDDKMYNNVIFNLPVSISRATQYISMNDGEVKVAVDGIDAGAADSKIDLDNLIASQTIDAFDASRAGVVTYEVISANKANATIGEGNIFSATVCDTYKIRATKAQTAYYAVVTGEFFVTVKPRTNTLTISGTAFERFVDEEITSIRSLQNSDATVETSSTDASIAYYDVTNNKIVIPNSDAKSFITTTVTIKIWQAATPRFEASGEKTITLTVKKYPTSFTGSSYNLMVDAEQEANYTYTHTSAAKPTANSADNFYYAVEEVDFTNETKNKGNEFVTFNPNNKRITAKNAGTGVITLRQKETYKYTGDTASFTVKVYKYNSTYANVANLTTRVDEDVTSAYTLTYTKPNNAYIGENNIVAGVPTLNEGEFHYTLTQNVTTSHTEGSPDASLAITYNASTKTATGKNQGKGTIRLYQEETYKYNAAAEKKIVVTVNKHSNAFACSWDTWTKTVNFNDVVSARFTSNNTDYEHFPIVIEQTSGSDIASLVRDDATNNTITASYNIGTAKWQLSQAENYKYEVPENAVCTLNVTTMTSPECYVLDDPQVHGFMTGITDGSGHFDAPIAVSGSVNKLYFDARRSILSVSKFIVQYSVDNGINWRTIGQPDLHVDYNSYGPYSFSGLAADEKVTHIRFGAEVGGTLIKYYKNILISRKTWMRITNSDNQEISSLTMPLNTIGNSTKAKFYIDYSTCDDEIKLAVNNSHFSLSTTQFESDGDNVGDPKEITVTYTSNTSGTHTGVITIYTKYEHRTIIVNGTTEKKTQTITWSEGFEGDPAYLPVGLKTSDDYVAATASSGNFVTYSTNNPSVIQIIDDGNAFEIVGEGTATLTAHVDGDADWKPAEDSKTIITTDKKVQAIQWTQDFTDGLALTDEVNLDAVVYVVNARIGLSVLSPERTELLQYSCPDGNGVISVADNKMTIIGYGQTTITATAPADDEYMADEMTLTVIVREPSAGCETPYVLEYENLQLFSWGMDLSGWTTPEITSTILYLNSANGKPDKLSYQHNAEVFTIRDGGWLKFLRGTVKAQQRINGIWYDIAGSSFNNGGKEGEDGEYDWRTVENLQLDVNANAIRFVREEGGEGYHNFRDIKITLLPYLRATDDEATINLGTIRAGELREGTIPFEYSNVKGNLTVTVGTEDPDFSIARTIEMTCGTHGHYELPFTFQPMTVNDHWTQTVTITDPLTSQTLTITLVAEVTVGDQWIRWNTPTDLILPDVPILNAVASSSLPVEYEILSGNASIVNGEVVLTGTGEVVIRASQPGNESFNAADPVVKTFTINEYIFLGKASDPSEKEMWSVAENWNLNSVPTAKNDVTVKSNLTIINEEVAANKMTIGSEGKVVISYDGGMNIGKGGIVGATTENLILKADSCSTSPTKGQTGYLRISPECTREMPNATVELFSIAYYDMSAEDRNEVGRWQFVGYPINDNAPAKTVFSKSFLYSWNATIEDWENKRKTCLLQPFEGYATSQYRDSKGWLTIFAGQLVPVDENVTIDLAYNDGDEFTYNMLANSFTAPIDLTKFDDEDFINTTGAVYIFNTGSRNDVETLYNPSKSGENMYVPGQYITIPIGSLAAMKAAFPSTPTSIAPMQGFCVHATGNDAQVKIDYSKLVWKGDYEENGNAPLHIAPRNSINSAAQVQSLCVSLYADGLFDNLYILENEQYVPEYENGYDAPKMMSGELNIFSVAEDEQLAVDATNSIIGTRIGVRTGEETEYIISFSYLNSENPLALLDMETEQITEITEWTEYSFSAAPNTVITDRFMIIEGDGSHMPTITTDVDEVESDVKVFKFIKDNQLFILKNGVLYNASGILVRK